MNDWGEINVNLKNPSVDELFRPAYNRWDDSTKSKLRELDAREYEFNFFGKACD